jgi:hypothetical protein
VIGFSLVGAETQVAQTRFPASNLEEKLFATGHFNIDEKYA